MPGIIVIDGCDATGKTTLAYEICKLVDESHYMHLSFDLTWDMWQYQTDALVHAVAASAEKTVVIDRMWPSENVYADTYRKGVGVGIAARMMHRMLIRFGALYILATPPTDFVVKKHKEMSENREEMYKDVSEVSDRFLDLYKGTALRPLNGNYVEQLSGLGGVMKETRWFEYDIMKSDGQAEEAAKIFLSTLNLVRGEPITYQPGLDPHWGNLAGRVHEDSVLFVGDKAGTGHTLKWPFYENDKSSLFLTEALHEIRADEERMCFMNAYYHQHQDKNEQMLVDVASKVKQVVALGAEANAKLHDLGIIHNHVSHPQYAMRFGGPKQFSVMRYAAEIKDALSD